MPTQKFYPADEESQPPYRCGVGIVVFNSKGQVLGCRRANNKTTHLSVTYSSNNLQWPQGGIDMGEDELETAYRELYEEVGIKREAVKLLARGSDYTFYDFPDYAATTDHEGVKYRGQRHVWFAFQLLDENHTFSFDHHHEVEFESVEWVELNDMPTYVIDFKRVVYQKAAAMFAPLVEQLRRK